MSQAVLSPASTNGNSRIVGREGYAPIKRQYKDVEVDGRTYCVQTLSAKDYGVYENLVASGQTARFDLMKQAKVLVSAVDADHQRVFRDNEIDAVGACGKELINELFRATESFPDPPTMDATAKNS